jgi:putative transcriptional regulator
MYHYTLCGLSYVYLKNGYEITNEDGEEYISFHELKDLHRLIGKDIINQPKPMTGEQAKYLRVEMNCSQKQVGNLLGVDAQTVARWEKNTLEPVDRTVDTSLRALYAESIDEESKTGFFLRLLADTDEKSILETVELELEEKQQHWNKVA